MCWKPSRAAGFKALTYNSLMTRSSRSKTAFLALAGFGLLVLLTLGRLAFLAHFQGLAWEAGLGRALYLGFKFDARWVAILGSTLASVRTGADAAGSVTALATLVLHFLLIVSCSFMRVWWPWAWWMTGAAGDGSWRFY